MNSPFFVGITGGSGSGKTHFLQSLKKHFSDEEMCVVIQDNYYYKRSLQPKDSEGIENFDTPQSIDSDRFYKDLLALKGGQSISLPEYTFNNPNVEPRMLTFHPAPVIVVEGIMIYHFEKINSLFDLRLFIDANEIVKLKRRIKRDKDERGYDLDDVLYRYEHHVTPHYEKYIKPKKEEVDLVIPNNKTFEIALNMVVEFLRIKLVR
jgi:uridine kinase